MDPSTLIFILHFICSGDPEIGLPVGLTESGPIYVKPANFARRDTSQSVYRYALLHVDIEVDF